MVTKFIISLRAFWQDPKNRWSSLMVLAFFLLNSLHLLSGQWSAHPLRRLLTYLLFGGMGLVYYRSYCHRAKDSARLPLPLLGLWAYAAGLTYLITLSLNINNPDVLPGAVLTNGFAHYPFHWMTLVVGSVVIGSWLLRSRLEEPVFDRLPKLEARLFNSQLLASFLAWNGQVSVMMGQSAYFQPALPFGQRLWHFAWLYLGLSLFAWLLLGALKGPFKSVSFAKVFSYSFHLALVANYAIQAGLATKEAVVNRYLFAGAFSFQVLLLTACFLTVFLLVNRTLLVGLLLALISLFFALGNSLKFTYRAEPTLPSDLVWLGQLKLLFSFVAPVYLVLVLSALALVGGGYWFLKKQFSDDRLSLTIKQRLGGLAGLLALFGLVAVGVKGEQLPVLPQRLPIVSALTNTVNINYMGNAVNAKMKSLAYVWIKQLVTPVMERPEGYSQARMSELEAKYLNLAKTKNKGRQQDLSELTVIYILSESFSDPTRLPGVSLSQDPIPYIKSLMKKHPSGLMQSDGYGGGTANMEFQSLTGLPMYNMSSSISTINTEVGVKMPVIPAISDHMAPENRYAIHLESGKNYSRTTIYRKLGFGTFIGRSDVDTVVTDFERLGLHPSDASTYGYVLDHLDEDQAQFFSVLTMQNHVPWSVGDPANLVGQGEGFSPEENGALTSYARLLYHTDQATKAFLAELNQLERPVMVVFYGDHLPSLYPKAVFEAQPGLKYQTDFFIWSNKPLKETKYPLLNSSDLTAAMLEAGQIKLSPYQALLVEVLNKASVDRQEEERDPEVAHDLKLVEYDLISGHGYLTKSPTFFETGE